MNNCINSYYASNLIKKLIESVLLNKNINQIDKILRELHLMRADAIIPCMECPHCYDFIFYSQIMQEFLDRNISKNELMKELHLWRKTQLRDEALSSIREVDPEKDFNREQFETSKTKVYLDQNIFSSYVNDEEFKVKLDEFINIKNMCFFYSPSHLEEIYKIPNVETKLKTIEAFTKITKNVVILPVDDKNIFFVESPEYGLRRVEKHEGSTEALEELKLVSSKDREIYLKKYDNADHKRKIANNNNIFQSLSENDFRELVSLSHSSIYEKNSFKNIESRKEVLHAIYTLSNMLDLLGYKIDKREKTQKSSLHDVEHLIYALEADLFITNDKNLLYRAIQIYKFMDVDVEAMSLNNLLEL